MDINTLIGTGMVAWLRKGVLQVLSLELLPYIYISIILIFIHHSASIIHLPLQPLSLIHVKCKLHVTMNHPHNKPVPTPPAILNDSL